MLSLTHGLPGHHPLQSLSPEVQPIWAPKWTDHETMVSRLFRSVSRLEKMIVQVVSLFMPNKAGNELLSQETVNLNFQIIVCWHQNWHHYIHVNYNYISCIDSTMILWNLMGDGSHLMSLRSKADVVGQWWKISFLYLVAERFQGLSNWNVALPLLDLQQCMGEVNTFWHGRLLFIVSNSQ